jgi:hypothetical protein
MVRIPDGMCVCLAGVVGCSARGGWRVMNVKGDNFLMLFALAAAKTVP